VKALDIEQHLIVIKALYFG